MLLQRNESYIVKFGERYLNEVSEDDYSTCEYITHAFCFDTITRAKAAALLASTFANRDSILKGYQIIKITTEYWKVEDSDEQS